MDAVTSFFKGLFQPPYTYLLCFALGVFVLGAILRLACGTARAVPRSAAACFAILFIYVVSIVSMGAEGQNNVLLAALPFFNDLGDSVKISTLIQTDFSAFLLEAAQMLFLAFTVNLLQELFGRLAAPKGFFLLRFFVWYFWQCVIIVLSLAVNYLVNYLIGRYVSAAVAKWLPVALLILLTALMVLMALKLLLKTVAFFANPVITALSGFFFQNKIGRSLTGAFLTTGFISAFVLLASRFGWLDFFLGGAVVLTSFVPVILLLLVVWYLVWILW